MYVNEGEVPSNKKKDLRITTRALWISKSLDPRDHRGFAKFRIPGFSGRLSYSVFGLSSKTRDKNGVFKTNAYDINAMDAYCTTDTAEPVNAFEWLTDAV